MKKSPWRFLKNKWFWIIAILVLIIAGTVYAKTRPKAPNFETSTATIGNVVEQVSVTGTVSPVSSANLAFEKGGVISKIYVSVGDTVKAGDPIASLDSADDQAALASAQATLADMSRSLTPTELAVQTTSLSNAVRSAYASAQSAVVNYADTFFNNPQSANPVINITTQSSQIGYSLNNERVGVSTVLDEWSVELATATDTVSLAADSIGYLSTIKSFLSDLDATVQVLSPGNSGLTQAHHR